MGNDISDRVNEVSENDAINLKSILDKL